MRVLFDHSTPAPLRRFLKGLSGRRIAIIELGNSRWPVMEFYTDRVLEALARVVPGCYLQVEIPFR